MSIQNVSAELESSIGLGIRAIHEIIKYSDFTDGGSTAGSYSMKKQIPAGSFVLGTKVNVLVGFTGDTTCTLAIGDSGDANVYSANTTHNIYTAASNLVREAMTGTDAGPVAEATANTVVLAATGGADFTSVSAGKIEVWVFYFSTNVE